MMRFKTFRNIVLGILIFTVVLGCFWQNANAQVIEIPDPNLERAIREKLGLSSELPITQQEMLRLTSFAAEVAQVANITGLEYARNLKRLYLRNNPIEDLTPIANLKQLELLHLVGVPITDLIPIQDLTELRELHLSHCGIIEITPLANLTRLNFLHLGVNQIVDISPLSNLTMLETLWLQRNQIVDISSLANLTALTELRVDSNQIVDVSPLANLTRLTDLTIANNAITDFRPLFGLNLQSVDVDIHKLQELASSEIEIPDPNLERAIRETLGLPSHLPITEQVMLLLYRLPAAKAEIENLTGLEYAHNLENLSIPNNPIHDLTPISNLTQLRYLNLAGIPIKDLTFLSNLTQLQKITLVACHIRDITPLANLTQLISLNIRDNWIVDISPLANLNRLERLRINSNSIVDISPLANLTALKELWLERNRVLDFSPIQGLSIADLRYDEVCLLPDPPIRDRIENRSLPSIVQGWRGGTNLSPLSPEDFISYHDIYWTASLFGLHFLNSPLGYTPAGVIEDAIVSREEYLAKNPNMIFLLQIRINSASYSQYPEDWFGWVRDENGNTVRSDPEFEDLNLIDMRLPEVQDIIVQQAVAVSTCGLYDGIMFDWWPGAPFTLTSYNADGSLRARERVEENITLSIIQRIRRAVPDDFLVLCNRNEHKLPLSAPYINGSFMETFPNDPEKAYTRADIIEIETNLIWLEQNLREPQINCLRGRGISTEPPDSPNNRRWMRLFTTMSLTLSDGYALYTVGGHGQHHIWYDFWDADLGQPIGPTTQRYQDIEGLYIREFTNGWAVYNRSGTAQEISLTEEAMGVSSNQTGRTHQLPDLDGEIYLRAGTRPAPTDLNGDGIVNVLDLILVAQHFGTTKGDINGDGITNILDLILVAQHLGETSAPAAPAAFHVSLSPETVQKWIDMAYAQNDGSVIFAQGIAMLERLLALMIPDKTVLRANYPNPFNPETWIPYHLASETEVRISIYDLRGVLVRQFNLGHQKAGYYTNRTKAAHWDGRNEIGESVASGIYFYTLTTDDYTGTRRMVILK